MVERPLHCAQSWTCRSSPCTPSSAQASRCRSTSSRSATAGWSIAASKPASHSASCSSGEGRETGPLDGRISRIGTTALIRDAGRYPDGHFDLMTVGGRRFRIESLTDSRSHTSSQRCATCASRSATRTWRAPLAERVSSRFLRYLEVLQPALEDDDDDGPDYEVEVIVDDDPEGVGASSSAAPPLLAPAPKATGTRAYEAPRTPTDHRSGY